MAANTIIEYRLLPDGDWQVLPPSQAATLALFLYENRGTRIVWDDMYRALGSHEVNRTVATLRKRGVVILCDLEAKTSGRGKVGVYRLGEGVAVRTWPAEKRNV